MNGIIQHRQLITEVKGQPGFSLLPALAALNIVPDEMLVEGDSRSFYDVFYIKQLIYASTNTNPNTGKQTPLVFWAFIFTNVEDAHSEICMNILETGQSFANDLFALGVNTYSSDDTNSQQWYKGNKICHGVNCMKDLRIDELNSLCQICDKNQCGVYLVLNDDTFSY